MQEQQWCSRISHAKTRAVCLQALTSVDVSARISRQGKKFLQQLTERAALNELMTAVEAKDPSALIMLYNVTRVCTHACSGDDMTEHIKYLPRLPMIEPAAMSTAVIDCLQGVAYHKLLTSSAM